jgi:hypothetical protein
MWPPRGNHMEGRRKTLSTFQISNGVQVYLQIRPMGTRPRRLGRRLAYRKADIHCSSPPPALLALVGGIFPRGPTIQTTFDHLQIRSTRCHICGVVLYLNSSFWEVLHGSPSRIRLSLPDRVVKCGLFLKRKVTSMFLFPSMAVDHPMHPSSH